MERATFKLTEKQEIAELKKLGMNHPANVRRREAALRRKHEAKEKERSLMGSIRKRMKRDQAASTQPGADAAGADAAGQPGVTSSTKSGGTAAGGERRKAQQRYRPW